MVGHGERFQSNDIPILGVLIDHFHFIWRCEGREDEKSLRRYIIFALALSVIAKLQHLSIYIPAIGEQHTYPVRITMVRAFVVFINSCFVSPYGAFFLHSYMLIHSDTQKI